MKQPRAATRDRRLGRASRRLRSRPTVRIVVRTRVRIASRMLPILEERLTAALCTLPAGAKGNAKARATYAVVALRGFEPRKQHAPSNDLPGQTLPATEASTPVYQRSRRGASL